MGVISTFITFHLFLLFSQHQAARGDSSHTVTGWKLGGQGLLLTRSLRSKKPPPLLSNDTEYVVIFSFSCFWQSESIHFIVLVSYTK